MSLFYTLAYWTGFTPSETAALLSAGSGLTGILPAQVKGGYRMGSRVRDVCEIQNCHWPGAGLLVAALAEFGRAVAAAQRYEQLKRVDVTVLAGNGTAPADIPRRIFEEFYSTGRIVGNGAGVPDGERLGLSGAAPAPFANRRPQQGRQCEDVKALLAEDRSSIVRMLLRCTAGRTRSGHFEQPIGGEWKVKFARLDSEDQLTGNDGRVVERGDFGITAGRPQQLLCRLLPDHLGPQGDAW